MSVHVSADQDPDSTEKSLVSPCLWLIRAVVSAGLGAVFILRVGHASPVLNPCNLLVVVFSWAWRSFLHFRDWRRPCDVFFWLMQRDPCGRVAFSLVPDSSLTSEECQADHVTTHVSGGILFFPRWLGLVVSG